MIDLPAPVSPVITLMPAIEFEIEMFNDGVVMYGQVHQHEGRSQAFRSGYLYSVLFRG